MKPGTITHTIAVLLSSVSSLFAHSTPKESEPAKVKVSKKSDKLSEDILLNINSIAFTPGIGRRLRPRRGSVIRGRKAS